MARQLAEDDDRISFRKQESHPLEPQEIVQGR